MKLTDISNDINDWFSGSGPLADIVVSSRIRLARNLAGHKFLHSCSIEEKSKILEQLKAVLMSLDLGDEVFYFSVDQAPALSRSFLVEPSQVRSSPVVNPWSPEKVSLGSEK